MPVTRAALLVLLAASCTDVPDETTGPVSEISLCGPRTGVVAEVIDGDTVRLETGEKVRYLMIDTPEITNGHNDCYGAEAKKFNADYVLGQEVDLTYDVECKDKYGRLLAYVEVPDGEMNSLLIARGYACMLYLPPNGEDREIEFRDLQRSAKDQKLGLWGACPSPCP